MQALLIYELSNKNHLKTLMTKMLHISWGGYDKGFYGILCINLPVYINEIINTLM